jgi:anti-sigma B factor antagonist
MPRDETQQPSGDLAASVAIDRDPADGGRVRVTVGGELDLASAPALRDAVLNELSAGNDVLLDISAVSFIDSTGLAAIVSVSNHAKSSGRRFVLSPRIQPQPQRLMELTQVLSALELAAD